MPTLIEDTIAAISTPIGKSGLGVVRLSGEDSREITESIFHSAQPTLKDRTPVLGNIQNSQSGLVLDEAVVTYFRGPRSFTREDVVEISCHGSPVVLKAILNLLVEKGARMATPGEFTLRAYLRGRIDLMQAEGIRDLIEAKTLFQAQVARQQASGSLSKRVQPIKESLINLIALLEAGIDFADDDVSILPDLEINSRLDDIIANLLDLDDSFSVGRLINAGLTVAIVGRPNVGKSSLFNAILNQNRAIVSEIPGTTRDIISETGDLGGMPIRWLDTAGIHNSSDQLENIGVNKSKEVLAEADRVLLVLDGSVDLTEEDQELLGSIKKQPFFLVINKNDLRQRLTNEQFSSLKGLVVKVSSLTGEGIDSLRTLLLGELTGQPSLEQDGAFLSNFRQKHQVEQALKAIRESLETFKKKMPHEVFLIDLHRGLKALDGLTGETTIEDILGNIFSTFCIGK